MDDYRPRFSFEITEEQKLRSDSLLSVYGLRKAIFSRILDDVLDLIEEYGGVAVGILLSGRAKPRDIIPSMKAVQQMEEKHGKP